MKKKLVSRINAGQAVPLVVDSTIEEVKLVRQDDSIFLLLVHCDLCTTYSTHLSE